MKFDISALIGGAEARLPRLAGAKLYTYCTAHGLMRHEPARR